MIKRNRVHEVAVDARYAILRHWERFKLAVGIEYYVASCAYDCGEEGPRAVSPSEATEAARKVGWMVSRTSQHDQVCPGCRQLDLEYGSEARVRN